MRTLTWRFARWSSVAANAALGLSLVGCGTVDAEHASANEEAGDASPLSNELRSPTAFAALPVLSWQACGEEFPEVECAVAAVPLDYDRPHGAKTGLALARIPATDPEHKLGTVFINPGGPGGSGVSLARDGFGELLSTMLEGRFDVVGFDPRGIGASEPLRCFETQQELVDFFTGIPGFPYERAQERPYFERRSSIGDQCFGRHEPITAHMSTGDVARDLDLLRRAVGDERLTYLGFSYGTQLGNTYANLFPSKVRAMVLDGVIDPRQWVSGTTIVSDRVATAEVNAEFMRLCDEAGEDCAFSAPGGAAARFEALADAIRATPLDFGDFLYSYDYLISDTTTVMYAPEVWGGADGWAAALSFLADASAGQSAALESAKALRTAIRERIFPPAKAQEPYDNSYDGYLGVHCADAEFPRSFPAWHAIGKVAASSSRMGPLWWWQDAGCSDWPTSRDRYVGPWTARTRAPVLLVGNYFDPATRYDGAVASSELLRNARLLSYAGWGHTAFGRSACATESIVSYLRDGSLPPEGTVCPANPNPLVPLAALRTAHAHAAPLFVGLPQRVPGRH